MIIVTLAIMVGICLHFPEYVWAQFVGSGFEGRMKGLTNQLMTIVLPLMSVLGLVYAQCHSFKPSEQQEHYFYRTSYIL